MSDVQNSTTAVETPSTEPATTQQPDTTTEEVSKAEPDSTETAAESSKPEEIQPVTESKDEAAPVEEKKDEVAASEEKTIEPISEGKLSYKAPGFLKSLFPSKNEFWLSDDATSPQDLNSYMRGEKPEIAHAVVAWASQTGKGLLFFNKKGDTTRKQPGHVLALYDATDLKKEYPHDIVFKLNGHEHTLKAANNAERDGWFMSLEKTVEMGKASKEEIRESEGYKAEMEKLNKPNVAAVGATTVPSSKRSQSTPKKSSTEADKVDDVQRANSDADKEDKKQQKSRSTSRGVFNRLKGKKDESDAKKEEKKEDKEEKKVEEEETKPEESKAEEAAPVVAGGATAGAAGVASVEATKSSEDKKEPEAESPVNSTAKTEEKPKPTKRNSIFGKMQGWSSIKSPSKDKEQKDAELKPEVPPKDEPVSENPPQLPETNAETEPAAEGFKPETETKLDTAKDAVTTPGKEKKNYLSGLSFINKRNRSVSPSEAMKDPPAKTETAAEAPKEEVAEPAKTEEPAAETIAPESTEEPADKTEEPAKTEASKPNKRESVLGSLGRRASKAFKGISAPKKENAATTTEDKKDETAEAAPAVGEPKTNGESKPTESEAQQSIGDVVPDAINVGQPQHTTPTVTASA